MDSERELRSEFRRALDVVVPPAPWLEATVRARINAHPRPSTVLSPRRRAILLRWPLSRHRLTAAALVVVLAVAAVGIFLIAQRAFSQPVPVHTSPYRGTIAFVRIDANNVEHVFTVRADGSGLKQLVGTSACCAEWSHRGDRLLLNIVGGPRTTAIVNADGSNYRLLSLDSTGLSFGRAIWSPDDNRIAVEAWDNLDPSRNGIYTADAQGGTLNRLRITNTTQRDVPLAYSPDGSRILFRREPVVATDPSTAQLFVVGVGGGAAIQVSPRGMAVWGDSFFGSPGGWSPRGDQITFSAFSLTSKGRSAAFVVDSDGTKLRQISDWGGDTTSAHWSPTGEWIVFDRAHSDTDSRHQFFLVHPDGSGTVMIPSINGCCAIWSPDGQRLMYGHGTDNHIELWTIELDGSHIVHVTTGPANLTDIGWTDAQS